MIILVKEVNKRATVKGDDYLEVVGINTATQKEIKKAVFNQHQDKWPLLLENKLIEFVMTQTFKDGKPNWDIINIREAPQPGSVPSNETTPTSETHKPPNQETKYTDPTRSSIEAQTALNRAVELLIAGKIEKEQVLSYAEVFRRYLNGNITVKEEAVFESLITKHFKTEG